jgi:hypothetical protein
MMTSEEAVILDPNCEPCVIRTSCGDFEVDVDAQSEEDRKDVLEMIRAWLGKNVQAMLSAQAALSECKKKTPSWQPTIAVTLHSDDYGDGMYVTIGLEITPDTVEVQHWEGTTGEDVHVFYIGTIEPIESEEE